jgi:hypothetical protein
MRFRPLISIALAAGVLSALAAFTNSVKAMETGSAADSIEGYLGISGNGLSKLTRRLEEGLSVCMKKEGFEYTPRADAIPADAIDGGATDRKKFVEKYGYGISTIVQLPSKTKKDPNTSYTDALSKADRHSYYIALIGTDPEKSGAAAPTGPGGFDPKSCVGKATASVFGNMLAVGQLVSKYNDVDKRINANTDVVRAMRDWSACMKKGGFTFTKDADALEAINTRMSKLMGAAGGGPGDLISGGAAKIDEPGLKTLQKAELAQSKVDWDCSKQHLGVRDKVAKDLRKQFIAENKTALEPLKKVFGSK